MAWQEWVSPLGYTPLAQVIVSFVLGLLLSYWSVALVIVLLFLIVYDLAFYLVIANYDYGRWYLLARAGVIFAYIAGWIIGRYVLGLGADYLEAKDGELMQAECDWDS